MLPVSGAEQLKTSGDHIDAPHDLAQRGVFQVGQTGTVLTVRQEQIPQSGGIRPGFNSSMIARGCQRSPDCPCASYVFSFGIDVLVHERRQSGLILVRLGGKRQQGGRIGHALFLRFDSCQQTGLALVHGHSPVSKARQRLSNHRSLVQQ